MANSLVFGAYTHTFGSFASPPPGPDLASEFEPSREWRDALFKRVQDTYVDMVVEAKRHLEDCLAADGLTNDHQHDPRYTKHIAEYQERKENAKKLSQQAYNDELQRERCERRWGAGYAMPRSWTEEAIMDNIARKRTASESGSIKDPPVQVTESVKEPEKSDIVEEEEEEEEEEAEDGEEDVQGPTAVSSSPSPSQPISIPTIYKRSSYGPTRRPEVWMPPPQAFEEDKRERERERERRSLSRRGGTTSRRGNVNSMWSSSSTAKGKGKAPEVPEAFNWERIAKEPWRNDPDILPRSTAAFTAPVTPKRSSSPDDSESDSSSNSEETKRKSAERAWLSHRRSRGREKQPNSRPPERTQSLHKHSNHEPPSLSRHHTLPPEIPRFPDVGRLSINQEPDSTTDDESESEAEPPIVRRRHSRRTPDDSPSAYAQKTSRPQSIGIPRSQTLPSVGASLYPSNYLPTSAAASQTPSRRSSPHYYQTPTLPSTPYQPPTSTSYISSAPFPSASPLIRSQRDQEPLSETDNEESEIEAQLEETRRIAEDKRRRDEDARRREYDEVQRRKEEEQRLRDEKRIEEERVREEPRLEDERRAELARQEEALRLQREELMREEEEARLQRLRLEQAEEARRKEEEIARKEMEARAKEAEVRRKEEEARRLDHEIKRKEKEARAEARPRETELRAREAELKAKEEEFQRKQREAELQRCEEEKEEEARQREVEPRQREEDPRQREEEAKRLEASGSTQTNNSLDFNDVLHWIMRQEAPWRNMEYIPQGLAQEVMNKLQSDLDSISSSDFEDRRRIKCLRALSTLYDVLPAQLYLPASDLGERDSEMHAGGAFSDICRARYKGELVCLKILRIHTQGKFEMPRVMKAFCREALIWRQVSEHPNILAFYGVSTEVFPGRLCFISPWMEHGNINNFLGSHPWHDRWQCLLDVATGMEYLHGLDPCIIHKDIRGANILVGKDFRCRLADFGISLVAETQLPGTSTRNGGNFRWLPPELINESEKFDLTLLDKVDIYSFGCTVVEIYTGEPPFSNLRAVANRIALWSLPPPPRADILPPNLWDAVVAPCLSPSPKARPSASTILDALHSLDTVHRGNLNI